MEAASCTSAPVLTEGRTASRPWPRIVWLRGRVAQRRHRHMRKTKARVTVIAKVVPMLLMHIHLLGLYLVTIQTVAIVIPIDFHFNM